MILVRPLRFVFVALVALPACQDGADSRAAGTEPAIAWTHDALIAPGEVHFEHLRQLTDGGENAEAYFSFDDRRLSFQSTSGGFGCDQIFVMNVDGSNRHLVSTGRGVCTCAFFLPGDRRVLFASTHLVQDDCPPKPDRSKGYVWPLHAEYDIFTANDDGSDVRRLTDTPGYDAEATLSDDGTRIVFTSLRDGDPELYSMNVDGSDVRRLTHETGYDGGAFYSHDGKRIVYRADHPSDPAKVRDFEDLLAQGLVRPSTMELWIMDADGANKRQITHNGKANFCPFFTPDDSRIVFSSNLDDPKGREFDVYLIDTDGSNLERVTFAEQFDGFPMFSRDGRLLAFSSNRGGAKPGETNVFLARWRD